MIRKPQVSSREPLHGFTLIELLVVVTIIVVLLALLVPALDKALVQAQMALCGANLKSVASAATTYAVASQRAYPHRKGLGTNGQPNFLNDPWTQGEDRLTLKQYVHLDSLLDPLCDPLEIDPSQTRPYQKDAAQTTNEPYVMAGYYMFFGWRYTDHPANKGLKRLGDNAFSWSGGNNLFNKGGTWNFNILASDQNAMTRTFNGFASSHPDSAGLLPLVTLRNEPATRGTGGLGLDDNLYMVVSRWIISNTGQKRGPLDLNYAYTDGGVSRLNGIGWDWEQKEGVTSAPIGLDGPGPFDYWLILPWQ